MRTKVLLLVVHCKLYFDSNSRSTKFELPPVWAYYVLSTK